MDDAEFATICRMAALDVGPAEAPRLRSELARILDFFATLEEAGIEGPPLLRPVDRAVRLRPDRPRPCEPDPLLDLAPERRERYFVVPRVVQ